MSKPTEVHDPLLIYIAAALDIAGSIRIEVPRKTGEDKGASLLVWIQSKKFKLMELLQRRGAFVTPVSDGQFRGKWKDKKAARLLRQLLPYLHLRREQAKIGVEFMDERELNPTEHTDAIYRLRLKLQKKADEEDGKER